MIQLIRKKTVRRPTFAGWLLAVAAAALVSCLLTAGVYRFLAVSDAAGGGILVIEGWIPDSALEEIVAQTDWENYEKIYSTGVPIRTGRHLSEYESWPEMTAMRLKSMGFPETVHAVPAADVNRDRTLEAARSLVRRLQADGFHTATVDIVTTDLHARRTRLLFRRAMGKNYRVGIYPVALPDIGPGDWYASSEGVRSVIGELIAYCYARLTPARKSESN